MRRGAILVAIALAATVIAPNANASRRSSLAGNVFIEDVGDIFFLPHEVVNYVNYVWFDFATGVSLPDVDPTILASEGASPGGSGGSGTSDDGSGTEAPAPASAITTQGLGGPHLGNAGILFGNAVSRNFGFGIAVHRSDTQSAQIDGIGLGSVFHIHRNAGLEDTVIPRVGDLLLAIETLDWVDAMVGFSLSPALTMGARLSLGSNIFTEADLDGDDEGVLNPGASAMSFNLVGSMGYNTDAMEIDASVELSFASYAAEQIAGDDELTDTGGAFGLGVFGRAFFNMTESIDLGVLLHFATRSRAAELDGGDDDNSELSISELRLQAGVGPRYQIGDVAEVAAYLTLGIGQITVDPEGDDNLIDQVNVLLPGVNIAAEWHLLDWLTYRAGVHSEYNLVAGELQEDNDAGGDAVSAREPLFYWANGFGFSALEGAFNLDATLNWPIITNGPYLLSGQANSLFAMVDVNYSF